MDEQMKQWVERGYGFVRVPRADLLPLCLVGGPRGNLQALGTAARLVRGADGGDVALPTPRADATSFAMDLSESRSFSASADAAAVAGVLGPKAANVKGSAKLDRDCDLTLTYPSLKAIAVSVDDLDRLLERNTNREPPSDLEPLADNRPGRVRDLVNAKRHLYIVMEVVQAEGAVELTVTKKGGGSLDADLQGELASVSGGGSASRDDTFNLELAEPRTIAFRVMRLWWDEEKKRWSFEAMRREEPLAFAEAEEEPDAVGEDGWINLG